MDINKQVTRKILRQSLRGMYSLANRPNTANNMGTLEKIKISCIDLRDRQDLLNLDSTRYKYIEKLEQIKKNDKTDQNKNMADTSEMCENQHSGMTEEPSSSSYFLASDRSIFSGQLDDWLRGSTVTTEHAGVQRSRVPLVQRSTVTSTSLNPIGANIWYLLAMLLPLCSINNYLQWSCSTSDVVRTAELCLANLSRVYGQIRDQMQRLAEDNLARDLFATLMDIVLVLYAIGFLFLSLYQAAVFH